MKKLFLILFLFYSNICSSQIVDHFEDNNFDNPTWKGDITNFVINNQAQLQLNDTSGGSSFIYTDYLLKDSTSLSLFFNMEFAPSTNNQLEIHFVLDTPDITLASGYFIQIGENGSDDRWKLFQLNKGTEVLVAEGPMGTFGEAPASGIIQIDYLDQSLNIWFQGAGSMAPQLESTINNLSLEPGKSFLGILCNYTSTRSDKFYFDDLFIGPLIQDETPPEIVSVSIIDVKSIQLELSEQLKETTIDLLNFEVNNGIGHPTSYQLDNDRLKLILEFDNPFVSNVTYLLMIMQIEDLNGNIIAMQEYQFENIISSPPRSGDLVISEFFPDPNPSQGIPEAEFVEIYNNVDEVIDLSNLVLAINGRETSLTNYALKPSEYIIITKSTNVEIFDVYGNVLGLPDFPIIKNGSGSITLKKSTEEVLHHVLYDETMIQEINKKEGGWTFEIINPQLYCEGESNWQVSSSALGGTPGSENSVFDKSFSGTSLLMTKFLANQNFIEFEIDHNFYELPDILANSVFNITDSNIDSIVFYPPLYNSGKIHVSLQPGTIYTAKISDSIFPCNLRFDDKVIQFGIAQHPRPGDLIVNEVLFNPKDNGSDYIEILNISDKVLNLKKLSIGNRTNKSLLDSLNFQFGLLPDQHLCITPDKENILSQYEVKYPDNLFVANIPALSNNLGNVTLLIRDTDTLVIDEMFYRESMHHELIRDPDGVSLERIQPIAKPFASEDWHSAAATAGYGTPTSKNSQGILDTSPRKASFKVINRVFSKESIDGNTRLKIEYQLDKPGYVCNVTVYTLAGQLINKVYEQTLLSGKGELFWNGENDEGSDMPLGVYVLLIDAFHPSGDLIKEKLSCVLAKYF